MEKVVDIDGPRLIYLKMKTARIYENLEKRIYNQIRAGVWYNIRVATGNCHKKIKRV